MQWIINLILSLFKNGTQKTEVSTVPPVVNPETPTKEEVDNFPPKKFKIAIARGHGGNDSGAEGQGTNEVEYNTWVMKELEKSGLNISCHYGGNSVMAMVNAIAALPDLIIQMHLNSATNKEAFGCEILVVKDDEKSYKFAEEFAANFNQHFKRKTRRSETKGKKILTKGIDGFASLNMSKLCPKILVEPFFISSKNDFVSKEKYLEFMIKQLRQWGA